jgi:hypothetical protein
MLVYLFMALPPAALVALISMLFGGDMVKTFAIAYGVVLVLGGLASLFQQQSEVEVSGEIMTALWAIRATLGYDAEKEIQSAVSYQPYLNKNDGMYKYKPGCNIETIQAMAAKIATNQGVQIGNLAEATCDDVTRQE